MGLVLLRLATDRGELHIEFLSPEERGDAGWRRSAAPPVPAGKRVADQGLILLLYAVLYMPATRTQIYLTPDQRRKLDARRRREGKTLAALVRDAIDAYLAGSAPDLQTALDTTFGVDPAFEVPSRDDWEARARRIRD